MTILRGVNQLTIDKLVVLSAVPVGGGVLLYVVGRR
jgi:hypothetical protein